MVEVGVMDLDAAVEEEERRLEDHNEAQDARYFLGFGDTHGDPIEVDTVVSSQIGIGTRSTSPPVPDPSQADPDASGTKMKKRSKCWNDFDELTKTVTSTSELASYLDSDTITEFDEDFNVLSWWHQHKLTYPILSLLAKDVLTVPASTISSESTFSLAGRVIEEHRR